MRDLGDTADLGAFLRHHVQVHQLVVVVLVLLLGEYLRIHLRDEEGVAQRLGAGAVLHALETQKETAAVDAAGLDGERALRGGVRQQNGAGPEPQLRLVGADLDGDLALDAVGTADASDYQLHCAWFS
ncbi:hypothetical protein SALBM311S_05350 [Streptomyces alboniger]